MPKKGGTNGENRPARREMPVNGRDKSLRYGFDSRKQLPTRFKLLPVAFDVLFNCNVWLFLRTIGDERFRLNF